MTEKTPKTPDTAQNRDVSKNQAIEPERSSGDAAGSATSAPAASSGSATAPVSGSAGKTASGPAVKTTSGPVDKTAADTTSKAGSGPKTEPATAAKAAKTAGTTAESGKGKPAQPAKNQSSGAAKTAASGGGSGGPPQPPASSSAPAGKKPSALPLAIIALAVVALAGGLWYQHNTSQQHIAQLQSQARASADQARLAEQKAQQALDALNEQRNTMGVLRAELQESRTEFESLSNAFQTITDRGSDLVLLNDIDHLVMIAQQQLQLNGNVANAIISLETAQAQLARANRPALASLQQTINGDLNRLRATTTVDIARLSSRLDELAGLIGQAPLLVPDDAVSDLPSALGGSGQGGERFSDVRRAADSDPWWKKAWLTSQQWTLDSLSTLRGEFGQFISVRRVDDPAALLISPDQATRFRDSLRQRIMTAQLALMMDQSQIWHTETSALLKAIESRFDPQSAVTRQAIRIARDVADTSIDTPLPDVQNSIYALEAMSEQMGRRSVADPSADVAPADSVSPVPATDADDAGTDNQVESEASTENGHDAASENGFAAGSGDGEDAAEPGSADNSDVANDNVGTEAGSAAVPEAAADAGVESTPSNRVEQ